MQERELVSESTSDYDFCCGKFFESVFVRPRCTIEKAIGFLAEVAEFSNSNVSIKSSK